MPYSDDTNDHWKVRDNDLVGGWIVTDYDGPLSEHSVRHNAGGVVERRGYVIADCMTKSDAEMVASLLNRAGVRR